jgi:uncharacterized protein (TIGR03083 family)
MERFVELTTSVPEDTLVAGGPWTARDLVGHVLTVARRYTERDISSTEGLGATPREVDRLNDVELAALGAVRRAELVVALRDQMEAVRRAFPADEVDLAATYPFHGGGRLDAAGGLSNLVGEFLLHGRDLALTVGAKWPIPRRDAELILNGVLQLVPAYARRDSDESLLLGLRTPGTAPWFLHFDRGTATSGSARPDRAPDVVLRAPAAPLVLALYSRLDGVRLLTSGILVVGGRRPWRLGRLARVIEQP